MFFVCVALAMLGVLVTSARRWLTKFSSRFTAALVQLVTFAGTIGVLVTEHSTFPSAARCIVSVSCAVIATVLLDAGGLTKAIAKGLGG